MIAYLVVSSFLISLLSLFFFVAVLAKGNLSFSGRNLAFCSFSFSIFVWSLGHMLWLLSSDYTTALFWVHVLVAGSIMVPYAYFHFAVNLTGRNSLQMHVVAGYVVGIILLCFNFSDFVVVGLEPRGGFEYWPVPGSMFLPYIGGYTFMVIFGARLLFSEYYRSDIDKKNQLRYITIGTVIGFLGGTTNFFLWLNIPIAPFGHAAVIFYILGLGYSMLKFRTLDFSEMSFRVFGLVVIAILFSGVASFGLVTLMDSIYDEFYPDNLLFWWVIFTLLSIFLLALGPYVNDLFNNFLHDRFLAKRFAYRVELRDLSDQIQLEGDLSEQFAYVVKRVSEVLSISDVALYTRSVHDFDFVCRGSQGERRWCARIAPERIHFLLDAFNSHKKSFHVEEAVVSSEQFRDAYFSGAIERRIIFPEDIVVPVLGRLECFGFLILGKGKHRTVLADVDCILLENICSQLGLSIKMREIERGSNQVEKLVSLGTMAAGLSHELRNPLVSIKVLASLLKKKSGSLRLDEAFSATVQRDVKRVISVVEGVSAFARNTDGSFKAVDLSDVLKESLSIVEPSLRVSRIEVTCQHHAQLPCLLGDQDQLVQVFSNLIENSINAISEWEERAEVGHITISTDMKSGRDSDNVHQWLIVDVKDDGPGIPQHLQKLIFEPFVTSRDTGERSKTRGTGLGLAIVTKIIERHGGVIIVNSDLGKGTLFTVSLPVKKIFSKV
ncbi:ATP-binding protein [Coraliomargarita algicola]|uniref:histidine kinase n=1 Tax=Coraliomargarita algicola TaxID=3092156 RepID=A0ABZ0RH89_9BACT|nr:ATP-binding protein [Coraliomargarita sp. J2-16]WPJ95516.1 ATP-binding protein [Coraliomargarita sp. J2-16]